MFHAIAVSCLKQSPIVIAMPLCKLEVILFSFSPFSSLPAAKKKQKKKAAFIFEVRKDILLSLHCLCIKILVIKMSYQEGLAKLSELEKRLCCSVGPVQPGPWVDFAGG